MQRTTTTDGTTVEALLPVASSPVAGLVLVHEAWGLNDDIREIARRLAEHGYAVAAPDLYSGGVRPLCLVRTLRDAMSGTVASESVRRIGGVRRWLAGQEGVDGQRVGVMGFCMGGGFALLAAARHDFAAAAVNYGRVPQQAEQLAGICATVGSYGAADRNLKEDPDRLRAHLKRLRVAHEVEEYPNAGHGFLNQGLPRPLERLLGVAYDPEAAAAAWPRMLAFLDTHLAASSS
ncbi:MAG: dienelactone hydrolase family protein [Egibacteraceae bacterium]